jgi:RNA polymerase sigma-70 factor (ECF subfamily)
MTQADDVFLRLVEPHRNELRLHCYRMLGSSHDSDDVLQETLVRAWRARASLEDPARLRPWLYRIATNACLDELKSRPRRALLPESPASDPGEVPAPPLPEATWLEPCPDAWLAGVAGDPSAACEVKESVALAFVAALQVLSAEQRAVLLLRDVVGMRAEEAATALGISLSAANSALHRARTAVTERARERGAESFAGDTRSVDLALLARYVQAWEQLDLDALVALLHDDVVVTMPPSPSWYGGLAAVRAFLGGRPLRLMRPAPPRLVPTGANAQPAFAFYRPDEHGVQTLYAIEVLAVRDDRVVELHHFMGPGCFAAFALPPSLPHDEPRV